VIDHLGKPPVGSDEMAGWASELRRAAERGNVAAKISGLNTCLASSDWQARDLHEAVAVALDAFGPCAPLGERAIVAESGIRQSIFYAHELSLTPVL
jgi:hypothetical protein